ncbi:MAG: rhodanese-like domain-containing protein [Flavobacteriaceae bacterium]|nr:rhodanese-like domain-containing protein [Flavobacteriaceae bacterium]
MRNLLFAFTFLNILSLNAQTWEYKSGNNVFDGEYKTSSISGIGTDYPYNRPILVINSFNKNTLNFYISNAGYFQTLTEIKLFWILNNESKNIYSSSNFNISDDGKTLFFIEFKENKSGKLLNKLDFIEKLKFANKVNLRIKTRLSQNDISFNLAGSNKAINYVISKEYKNKVIEDIKAEILKKEAQKKIDDLAVIQNIEPPILVNALKNANIQLVDVRTPSEFKSGHIEKSINMNYYDQDFSKQVLILDKNKPVYVYCRSGVRSKYSSEIFKNLGFKKIYNLQGGILNWSTNKLPLIK